jgi:hypothetical protein
VVLQYADDTLVIFRASVAAAHRLRVILDSFALATGLVINFHKSTLVPMHVDGDTVAAVRDALGCALEGFPQSYLGLPLSCDKLNLAAFAPLIAKADRYLSGWRAVLLSAGGRLVLINAVLDALPTYAMAAMILPPPVIKALDALRRAFLWAATERVSGAQCLVAWLDVCRPKEEGGLGIRSLHVQNRCLLTKLLHRLHSGLDSPWARWVWGMVGERPLTERSARELPGSHWASLCDLVPLYRSVSTVKLGDGAHCAFWHDNWLPSGALAATAPALYSHTTDAHASVAAVLHRGLDSVLVPRLTATGARERAVVLGLLAAVALSGDADVRVLTRCKTPSGRLRSSELDRLCCYGGVDAPSATFIWGSRAPSRVKFFAWLLSQARIQTRDTLLRKNILVPAECGCPLCPATLETAEHLILGCPFARQFWLSTGATPHPGDTVRELHSLRPPPRVPARSSSSFILLCCWQLWKHRNGVVFNGEDPSLPNLRRRCREDAALWRHRLPASQADDVELWLACLAI